MAKVQTMSIKEFMSGDYKRIKKGDSSITAVTKTVAAITPALTLIGPKIVLGATMDGTFGNVYEAIMRAFDAGVVLVLIFAGASWGLNHRTKAIEIIIGVSCGYILARHAIDIRDFLKGI
jgi:hypothetical protein